MPAQSERGYVVLQEASVDAKVDLTVVAKVSATMDVVVEALSRSMHYVNVRSWLNLSWSQ